MIIRLLTENILSDDDFLSATEQASPHIAQPVPASANTGKLRLLTTGAADGSISDWTYEGTATADGSTTTIIDDKLSIHGDDFFIGAAIEFTGGENSSGEKTITDFDGATGQLTWSGAVNSTLVGDTFTLTIPYATRSFIAALTGSGDIGDATCKWSHNNGSPYFGRQKPMTATWENLAIIYDNVKNSAYVATAYNPKTGVIVVFYQDDDDANDAGVCVYSADRGVTWSDPVNITGTSSGIPMCAECLSSGRFLVVFYVGGSDYKIYYSDDDGVTWALLRESLGEIWAIKEFTGGVVGILYTSGTYSVYFARSYDWGATYEGAVQVWTDASTFAGGDLAQIENGDIVAAVSKSNAGDYEIKVKFSSDGGASFDYETTPDGTPFAAGGEDYYWPRLMVDIDNGLLCAASNPDNDRIMLRRSANGTAAWETAVSIITDTVNDPRRFAWCLINPEIFLVTQGEGSAGANLVTNGDMEAGSPPSNWNDVGSPGAAAEGTVVHGGSQSLKWTDADEDDGSRSDVFTTVTGTRYRVGIYYRTTAEVSIRVRIRNGAGTSYRWSKTYTRGAAVGAWDLIRIYYTETSGGAGAYIEILSEYDQDSTTFYFDDIEVKALGGALLQMRRGKWELYAAGTNDCPCAIWAQPQKLICDVSMVWQGYAGASGDSWTFAAEYYFKMENILADSKKLIWRSEQDNIDCSIVLDFGATGFRWLDGIAFFNCNVRTLRFQQHTADSWSAPDKDEHVCFDVAAGCVEAHSGELQRDESLFTSYKEHELVGKYFQPTSGTEAGNTWQIAEHRDKDVHLDVSANPSTAVDDAFAVFQDHVFKTLSSGARRYLRIFIEAQQTAHGYYQIGAALFGTPVTLTLAWSIGFEKDRAYHTAVQQNADGDIVGAIQRTDPKDTFRVTWPSSDESRREVLALLDYCQGKNICLVPDDTNAADGSEDLTNGDFETAGGGGADVFGTWAENAGDGAIADETVNIHGGSHAAKLTAGASADTYMTQDITVTPGESRLLTFWSCVDSGDNCGRFKIRDYTNNNSISGNRDTNVTGTTYEQVRYVFTVPDDCTTVRVFLMCSSTNGDVCYHDDVSCKRLGKVTEAYLVKLIGDAQQRHRVMRDNFDFSVEFREV